MISKNSKAIFQVVNLSIFFIFFIIAAVYGTPDKPIVLVFSIFILLSGILRLIFKIPLRGYDYPGKSDIIGNIGFIVMGSFFPILFVLELIIKYK